MTGSFNILLTDDGILEFSGRLHCTPMHAVFKKRLIRGVVLQEGKVHRGRAMRKTQQKVALRSPLSDVTVD